MVIGLWGAVELRTGHRVSVSFAGKDRPARHRRRGTVVSFTAGSSEALVLADAEALKLKSLDEIHKRAKQIPIESLTVLEHMPSPSEATVNSWLGAYND